MKTAKNLELLQSGLTHQTPLSAMGTPGYRRFAIAILTVELIGAAALVVSPLAQKMLIDGVNAMNRMATVYGIIFVAALLVITLLAQTGSYLLRFRLGVEARCRLKSAVFHCLLGMPESFLKGRGSGYFFNRLQADSTEIVNFFAGNALLQFSDLLKFLLAFAVMLSLNWKCALFLLPIIGLQYLLYRAYRRKQYRIGYRIQECTASERYRMQEYLSGHTTLKTHNAAQHAAEKVNQGFAKWRNLAIERLFHENRFRILLTVPYYLALGSIAVFGLHRILAGAFTLGGLWAMLSIVRQVFSPVQQFASTRFQMQLVRAAWDRLRQITNAATLDAERQTVPCSLQGDVEFSHVKFAYPGAPALFTDLNFTAKCGGLFFLTGANGSGKTTIFQLLLRLYEPLAGEIRIGGRDVREFDVAEYRAKIGYLGQTPEFFPGTIRDNLLLNAKRSDAEIMQIFALLGSEALIEKRPGGLDALVLEHGENFSGGERLRLALVRELLRDTEVLLLDEPAANLDYEARRNFYAMLPTLQGRQTILAIVHDCPDFAEQYASLHLQPVKREAANSGK